MCHIDFLTTQAATVRPTILVSAHADLRRLRRVRDRLDREYDHPLDVQSLAGGAGLSPRLLNQQFNVAYGRSPYSYLRARRAERFLSSAC